MKRSILIITYYYSPALSARAFRWSAIAERWATQGHRVDVVTAKEAEMVSYDEINGVNVHRVNNIFYEMLRHRMVRSHKATVSEVAVVSRTSFVSRLVSVARWFYYKIIVNLYWPDAAFLWTRPASRKARELAGQHSYDAVVGVAPPFPGLLVAEHVFRHTEVPRWLNDLGDPFSLQQVDPHNNTKLYRRLNERVERRVLERSHAITVTTRSTRDLYLERFPSLANKIKIIPPLLSLEPVRVSPTGLRDDGRLQMLFAGTFYAENRPPDFLLKLFARLLDYPEWENRLELHIYGREGTARESFERYQHLRVQGKLVIHGMVDRPEVFEAMSRADVLVNVGNKTYYQLPSKVIEYASMGKPILNIMQVENDSSKDAYEDYPAVLNLLDEGGGAFDSKLEALHNWMTNLPDSVKPEVLDALLAQYDIEAVGRAYDELIE